MDFGQQCTNLQNQYTRMHGRMQLITGLNTALLPALGALAVAAGRNDVGHGWLVLFPVAGVLLSIIGYVAGANDRHLVVLYRKQLAWTAESLLLSNGVADSKVYDTWVHAGRAPTTSRTLSSRAPEATVMEMSQSPRSTSPRPGGSG